MIIHFNKNKASKNKVLFDYIKAFRFDWGLVWMSKFLVLCKCSSKTVQQTDRLFYLDKGDVLFTTYPT